MWGDFARLHAEWTKSGTSTGGSHDGCSRAAMAAGTQVPSGAPPSEKWKVRRHKHMGGFGDAGIIVCCMKLQEWQQADVNYLCLRGSVYPETFTLASPHFRKKLFLSWYREVFVVFVGGRGVAACEWKLSISLAQADSESPGGLTASAKSADLSS